MTKLDHFRSI